MNDEKRPEQNTISCKFVKYKRRFLTISKVFFLVEFISIVEQIVVVVNVVVVVGKSGRVFVDRLRLWRPRRLMKVVLLEPLRNAAGRRFFGYSWVSRLAAFLWLFCFVHPKLRQTKNVLIYKKNLFNYHSLKIPSIFKIVNYVKFLFNS